MIINIILSSLIAVASAILSVLPDLPDLPVGITDALDTIPELVRFTSRLITRFVGREFYLVVVPLIVILINFTWIYNLSMWIIRKLPIGVK